MESVDVFVWVEKEDGAGAAVAVRALRQRLKAEVVDWYLLGPRSERSERLAYDLGMKPLVRPEHLSQLGALAQTHGTAPTVIFWSGAAVLTADWHPVQGGRAKIWEAVPGAVVARDDLPLADARGWYDFQAQSSLDTQSLPTGQVKVVGPGDFEKAVQSPGWPFGHAVVILEMPAARR